MADSIPEELRLFGVTSKDFDEKKGVLTKTLGTGVDEKEDFFGLSVILEASKKTAGLGYALAEAEFAPDEKGR